MSPSGSVVKTLTNYSGGQKPLGDLMRQAHRTLVGHLDRALHDEGYEDIGAAHASVLATIDREGTRLATLVERGGRTKQATAELTAHMVRCGYLELHADPSDGRAKLYTPTRSGTRLLNVCVRIVVGYEAWLEDLLGGGEVGRLRDALSAIVDHEETEGS